MTATREQPAVLPNVLDTARMRARQWMADGSVLLGAALGRLAGLDLTAPTGLPGWSRAHVLAHLACGADALGRLAQWAHTGVPHPMYASAEQRAADIEADAARPPAELLARVRSTIAEFDATLIAMPAQAWSAPVVTAQGRTVPFSEVLWMRARETLVHVVDLDVGLTFADLPPGFCRDLLDEVTARLCAEGGPTLLLVAPHVGTWKVTGPERPTPVVGSLADLTSWVVGRGAGDLVAVGDLPLPDLPRWL